MCRTLPAVRQGDKQQQSNNMRRHTHKNKKKSIMALCDKSNVPICVCCALCVCCNGTQIKCAAGSTGKTAGSSQNMKSENCSPFYFVSVRCTKLYSMRRRKQINISGPREHRLPNTTAELGFVHFGSGGGGCNGCSVATVNAMIMSYRALHTKCDCKWHIESMRLIRLMNWLVSHCLQDKQSSSVL